LLLNITNIARAPVNEYYELVQSLGAALLILFIQKYNICILNNRVLVELGNISYELYLIHFAVLLILKPLCLPIYLFVLLSFLLSCTIAWALNRIVSQPIGAYFKKKL